MWPVILGEDIGDISDVAQFGKNRYLYTAINRKKTNLKGLAKALNSPLIGPDEMKTLWFTNNPCSSVARAQNTSVGKTGGNVGSAAAMTVTGGWHATLEEAVKNDMDLEIAYLSPLQKEEEFEFGGVKYRSINPFRSRFYYFFRLKRLAMPLAWQEKIILRRMREIIEKSQPDLIHIHGTERCFGLICTDRYRKSHGGHVSGRKDSSKGRLCAAQGTYICRSGKEIPVAISIQGLMGEITGRFFSGLTRKEIARNESLESKLKKQSAIRLYREFRSRARTERKILSSARYIFGRTEWDKEMTARLNPHREYFNVGEIMREPFFREWPGRPASGGRIRLVSILSTGPYKGFENILKTAALLISRGRVDFTWTVIGYSKDDEYVRISENVTGLSSEASRIIFTGRLGALDVAASVHESDIYCQVSHIENSPNSLCEAMLLGIPSVATDVGGTSSMAEDGKEALLVPDNDIQAYAEAIETLASDETERKRMGQAARAKAQPRHAPATVRAQLLEAYRSILEEQKTLPLEP